MGGALALKTVPGRNSAVLLCFDLAGEKGLKRRGW